MAQQPVSGAPAPVLAVVNGVPTTTSLDVALHFGKRHDAVLRAIRSLIAQVPADHAHNFVEMVVEVDIGSGATRLDPAYRLTHKGFTLLAMGFTGARALEFKLAYIDAFERLEAELSRRPLPSPAAPEIDVATLLLSGQSDPVPLTIEQHRLINQRAHTLGADAHALIHEHLLRAVAYQLSRLDREDRSHAALIRLLESITLGRALAHGYLQELRLVEVFLAHARETAANAHARVRADLNRLQGSRE